MKIPEKAPDYEKTIAKMIDEKKTAKLFAGKPIDEKGRYLHWDKLKHLDSPKGYALEEWWASIKLAAISIKDRMVLYTKLSICLTPSSHWWSKFRR